jgi:hypothetical protein
MNYKGYDIEPFGNGYTVFWAGEEIYSDTVEEAKEFIDEVVESWESEGFTWVNSIDEL